MSKKKEKPFEAAILGFQSITRLLIFILAAVIIILLGRLSYKFGYNVFYEQPVAEAPGTDVVVTIPEGVSAHQIGKLLEEAGLIEDAWVFTVQERLSAYHNDVKPGPYTLNTAQRPTEMLAVMSPADEEEEE